MYLDDVVVAGIIILVLTCVFLGGVAWYVRKHIIEDARSQNQNS
ncbi:MAG: hypothetical protein RL497_806 [Pseudomonadota bacterium]|jgi:hypothetical protein